MQRCVFTAQPLKQTRQIWLAEIRVFNHCFGCEQVKGLPQSKTVMKDDFWDRIEIGPQPVDDNDLIVKGVSTNVVFDNC